MLQNNMSCALEEKRMAEVNKHISGHVNVINFFMI